jgi:hypothetical protein
MEKRTPPTGAWNAVAEKNNCVKKPWFGMAEQQRKFAKRTKMRCN